MEAFGYVGVIDSHGMEQLSSGGSAEEVAKILNDSIEVSFRSDQWQHNYDPAALSIVREELKKNSTIFREHLNKKLKDGQWPRQRRDTTSPAHTKNSATEMKKKLPTHKNETQDKSVQRQDNLDKSSNSQQIETTINDPIEPVPYLQDQNQPKINCLYEKCKGKQRCINSTEKGFIIASCTEKCEVVFHRKCWDAFREGVLPKQIVLNEKLCMTPDCFGKVNIIRLLDMEKNLKWKIPDVQDDKGKRKKSTIPAMKVKDKVTEKSKREKSHSEIPSQDCAVGPPLHVMKRQSESASISNEPHESSPRMPEQLSFPEQSSLPTQSSLLEQLSLPDQLKEESSKEQSPSDNVSVTADPEAFLHANEGDLIVLKKPEEKIVVKKKKKKNKQPKLSNHLQYNLYPDSRFSPPTLDPVNDVQQTIGQDIHSNDGQSVVAFQAGVTESTTNSNATFFTGLASDLSTTDVMHDENKQSPTQLKPRYHSDLESAQLVVESRFTEELSTKMIETNNDDRVRGENPKDLSIKEDDLVTVLQSSLQDGNKAHEAEVLNQDLAQLTLKESSHLRSYGDDSSISLLSSNKRTKMEFSMVSDKVTHSTDSDNVNTGADSTADPSVLVGAEMMSQEDIIQTQRADIERLQAEIKSREEEIGSKRKEINSQTELIEKLIDEIRRLNAEKESLEEKLKSTAKKNVEICTICRDDLNMAAKIQLPNCSHFFHTICFFQYKGKNCPNCRIPIHVQEEFPPLS